MNRVVCYCDDCQAFLHHLGRADLMDAQGGSDIVQVAPASLSFRRGADRIAGLRLGPKGMYRWYATCCNTPLGNTLKPSVPFVGINARVFEVPGGNSDALFGKPVGKSFGQYAIGTPPPGSTKLGVRLVLRFLGMILAWKVRGRAWPHPFFDRASGEPAFPVTVLSLAEREAARKRCGPRPAGATAS